MKMKRCTVEIVVDVPAKGALSDVANAIAVKDTTYIQQKSFTITKTEEYEELLPFEKVRVERKAVRDTLLLLFKKHKLPLNVWYNQDHGSESWVQIRPRAAALKAYLERHAIPACTTYWHTWQDEKICERCRINKKKMFVQVEIENALLVDRNGSRAVTRGTISDPEMTQFMEYLNKYFAWCKKPETK